MCLKCAWLGAALHKVFPLIGPPPTHISMQPASYNLAAISPMSPPIDIDVFFDGSNAADCERFILAVKRRAFAEGKQNDDLWVAQYANTCISGPALRWYERLDDDVQASWKLLRWALSTLR